MEECEDVARRLTTNGWTMKLGAVVEAKAELDQICRSGDRDPGD